MKLRVRNNLKNMRTYNTSIDISLLIVLFANEIFWSVFFTRYGIFDSNVVSNSIIASRIAKTIGGSPPILENGNKQVYGWWSRSQWLRLPYFPINTNCNLKFNLFAELWKKFVISRDQLPGMIKCNLKDNTRCWNHTHASWPHLGVHTRKLKMIGRKLIFGYFLDG